MGGLRVLSVEVMEDQKEYGFSNKWSTLWHVGNKDAKGVKHWRV